MIWPLQPHLSTSETLGYAVPFAQRALPTMSKDPSLTGHRLFPSGSLAFPRWAARVCSPTLTAFITSLQLSLAHLTPILVLFPEGKN